MYTFAAVVLLGLVVAKVIDLVSTSTELTKAVRIALTFILGATVTWVTDYSMFAAWDIEFRSLWMGPVFTGLVIGSLAMAYPVLLGALARFARGSHDHAEVERIPRSAA